jgi:hypothetical protein
VGGLFFNLTNVTRDWYHPGKGIGKAMSTHTCQDRPNLPCEYCGPAHQPPVHYKTEWEVLLEAVAEKLKEEEKQSAA